MSTFILIAAIAVGVYYLIYINLYFKSEEFIALKNGVTQHIDDCNDLNDHIEELKSSYVNVSSAIYGEGVLSDNSVYNMKRRTWKDEVRNEMTYNCSSSVCKNASNQPFKYLCKYFNIEASEITLAHFEGVLNNFAAAEQGKVLLQNERDAIVSSIKNSIPSDIYFLAKKRLIRELGFKLIDLSDLYFPVYAFQYVSAGGNSAAKLDIKLDVNNLNEFVAYLSSLIKFRKSVAGQRALMTSALREKIKRRDNFTCQICSLSSRDEANLLLEIDHIIPLSRGGITCENNLQTLCWKCNRAKGARIITRELSLSSGRAMP